MQAFSLYGGICYGVLCPSCMNGLHGDHPIFGGDGCYDEGIRYTFFWLKWFLNEGAPSLTQNRRTFNQSCVLRYVLSDSLAIILLFDGYIALLSRPKSVSSVRHRAPQLSTMVLPLPYHVVWSSTVLQYCALNIATGLWQCHHRRSRTIF